MNVSIEKPEFPITVLFYEDGEKWVFENEEELACSLEWFDSADPEESTKVTDNQGRSVHVVVKELELNVCKLLKNT